MLTNNDADNKEKATSADSSTDEKTDSNVSEDDKTQDDELGSGIKNYDTRFKEIYRQKKELERENEELKTKVVEPADSETDFNPTSWDEVIEKVETRLSQKQTQKEKTIEAELSNVNKQIADLKELNPKLDEDKIWQYMEANKTLNVYEAFIKTNKEVGETTPKDNKQVAGKIGSNTQNATSKPAMSYEELHRKGLDDI